MTISIRDVEGILSARKLQNPSLDALRPDHQPYRTLLLQPAGPILADASRIGPLDLELADHQARKFLELAKTGGHHLVVTPEYYLPISTLLWAVQGPTFPAAGALWVLGCESMTPKQLEGLVETCSGHADVIFEMDSSAAVQGVYFDPVAYCFQTRDGEGNFKRVVLIQFKTISSRDAHFFENKNLRCGTTLYQFKGDEDVLSLATIICSDAFNVAQDEQLRRKLASFATLIHIQLNPKPRHSDYLRYRIDTFSKNKALNNCDIVCLNWAENMVQYDAPGGKHEAWQNESGSAWYISDDRCSSKDEEVERNERLGLYYSRHVKHRHVLHFHFAPAAFELTVAKIAQTGSYVHDNPTGPKLDARYTWDGGSQSWASNPDAPESGLTSLCSLTARVGDAFSTLRASDSRLRIERAIALSCGLTSSKPTWYGAASLDSCKLGEDEIVRRDTLALDRDAAAKSSRELRAKRVGSLNHILSTETLPFNIRDLAKGGIRVDWRPDKPHVNIYKDGAQPALVAYLGMEPHPDLVRGVGDAAVELLRLENKQHQDRVAVCYHDEDGRPVFARLTQVTDITRGGGKATNIDEGL